MKNKIVLIIGCLSSLMTHASDFKSLGGLNLGYGYLSAEHNQSDKKGINFGAKLIGSWEFKQYFFDAAVGYQTEFLKADYISIQNNTPTGEISLRLKSGNLSFGPMVQAQSGVYSSKPTTSEPSKVISNVGLQAVYKVDDYKPRYELSVLNSIGSNNMSDRNLTSVRLGIQFPFGSKPKEPSAVKQVAYLDKHLPIIIIPGFVSKSDYVLQETNLGFKRNSYELDSHSSLKIKKLAEFLVLNKIKIKKIEITGHADELGTSIYNKNLSNKRATVVKDIFVENHVDSKILIVSHGKGFSEPIEEFKTQHSVKNRRTEIKFIDVKISDKLNKELNDIINDTTK